MLQGESYLNKSGVAKDKGLIDLGSNIFKEVSIRRYKVKSVTPLRLSNGSVVTQIANPAYDPSYGQQQNSNSTTTDNKQEK